MPARREPQPPTRWPAGTIVTVGHSNVSIETFLALLRPYEIECLADIRTVPRSRHNPQFNADALASELAANDVEYVPLQALGGLRHPRKDSPNTGWRTRWCMNTRILTVIPAEQMARRASDGRIGDPDARTVAWQAVLFPDAGPRAVQVQRTAPPQNPHGEISGDELA